MANLWQSSYDGSVTEGELMSDDQRQSDIDELRGLLDLMTTFRNNDQRARYLLSSNWLRERGAAAAANAQADLDRIRPRAAAEA